MAFPRFRQILEHACVENVYLKCLESPQSCCTVFQSPHKVVHNFSTAPQSGSKLRADAKLPVSGLTQALTLTYWGKNFPPLTYWGENAFFPNMLVLI